MSRDEGERLTSATAATEPERFAADVLRAVGEPAVPDAARLAQVRQRLDARIARAHRAGSSWLMRPAITVTLVVAIAGGVMAARGLLRGRDERALQVPAGTVAHLQLHDGRMALVGRTVASIERDGSLRLQEGTVAVITGEQPATITTGDSQLVMAPRTIARAMASAGLEPAFAAVSGSVTIERAGTRLDIAAGSEWRGGVGTVLSPGEADSVRRLLGETTPPVEAAVTPTVATEPREPIRTPRPVRAPRPASTGAASQVSARPAVLEPPQAVAVAAPAPAESESHVLAQALRKLRQERDARGALQLLDGYAERFPRGRLAPEAALGRVEALMALDRRNEALRLLETTPSLPLGRETAVLRGELRASAGRCREAIADFGEALSASPRDALDDRALFGRAFCRARGGDRAGGRTELERYLSVFPQGRFAAQARRALEQP